MRALTAVMLAGWLGLGTACDSGTGPGQEDVDHLELLLNPARPAYVVLDSTTVVVTAFKKDGSSSRAFGASFRSLAPNVAIVDPVRGVVYARHNGTATIEVSFAGKTAQIAVGVRGTLHPDIWIDASQTWRVADTPHVVTQFMSIGGRSLTPPPDTTVLTIEPGATVRFRTGAGLVVGDIGPAALRLPGGSTVTMEADTIAPPRGSWIGLRFEGIGHSQLRNLTIRDCGHDAYFGDPQACLFAAGDYAGGFLHLLMDSVTIAHGHNGLALSHWFTITPGSRNLSIEDTDGYLGQLSPQVIGSFPRGGHFTGNAANEMEITLGALYSSATWSDIGVPLRLTGGLVFSDTGNPILTLPAGTHLRIDAGAGFSLLSGGIVAGDTAGAPVVLESTGQGWVGISSEHAGLSALRNVVLKDCGVGTTTRGCLVLEGRCATDSGLVAQNLTIQGSRSAGIWLGICGKIHPTSRNITVTGSAGVPFNLFALSIPFLPAGNYVGNGWDVILIRSGNVGQRMTWRNLGIPYALLGGFLVDSTLTLEPGVAIQVDTGRSFGVGWGLVARGTAAEPITFTSFTPGVPGSWIGIEVGNAPEGTVLENVVIADAGGGTPGYSGALRFSVDPGGLLTNSTIRRSADCALIIYNGNNWTDDYTSPAFGNTFLDVAGPLRCQV